MSVTPTTTSTTSSSHAAHLVQNQDTRAIAGARNSVSVDVDTTKDVRAHEHARQRTKTRERRDHALARERKEKAAAVRVLGLKGSVSARGGAHGGHGHGGANVGKLVRRVSMESWDGDVPRDAEPEEEAPDSVTPRREGGDDKALDQGGAHGFTELTLGDVISRPRRSKAKQLDFEVVSPIRTVIALDDAIDGDEAWEYITRASVSDGSASWKGKSYAQAVVSAM